MAEQTNTALQEIQEAVKTLRTTGVLARNEEEAQVLTLWREMHEEGDRRFCLGLLAGLTAKT